jgi:hypothetical protein
MSEQILCRPKKLNSITNSPSSLFKNNKKTYNNTEETYPPVEKIYPISEQILPITEIKPCFSYRLRSLSNGELKFKSSDIEEFRIKVNLLFFIKVSFIILFVYLKSKQSLIN